MTERLGPFCFKRVPSPHLPLGISYCSHLHLSFSSPYSLSTCFMSPSEIGTSTSTYLPFSDRPGTSVPHALSFSCLLSCLVLRTSTKSAGLPCPALSSVHPSLLTRITSYPPPRLFCATAEGTLANEGLCCICPLRVGAALARGRPRCLACTPLPCHCSTLGCDWHHVQHCCHDHVYRVRLHGAHCCRPGSRRHGSRPSSDASLAHSRVSCTPAGTLCALGTSTGGSNGTAFGATESFWRTPCWRGGAGARSPLVFRLAEQQPGTATRSMGGWAGRSQRQCRGLGQ